MDLERHAWTNREGLIVIRANIFDFPVRLDVVGSRTNYVVCELF